MVFWIHKKQRMFGLAQGRELERAPHPSCAIMFLDCPHWDSPDSKQKQHSSRHISPLLSWLMLQPKGTGDLSVVLLSFPCDSRRSGGGEKQGIPRRFSFFIKPSTSVDQQISSCAAPHTSSLQNFSQKLLRFVCSQIMTYQSEFKLDPKPRKSANVIGQLL